MQAMNNTMMKKQTDIKVGINHFWVSEDIPILVSKVSSKVGVSVTFTV